MPIQTFEIANFDTQQIELDEVGWIDASCWILLLITLILLVSVKVSFHDLFFFCLISKRC